MNDDTTNSIPLKRCSKCGIEKPATTEYFRPHKAYSNGLRPHCRECMREYDRLYLENNRDIINPRRAERHNSNPDVIAARMQREIEKSQQLPYSERRRIARKKWRDNHYEYARVLERNWKRNNPEKVHAHSISDRSHQRIKRWAKLNPQKRRAIVQRYFANNPLISIAKSARRRAKINNLPNTFTSQDWQRCLEYFNHRCAACGKPQGLWHVIAADHWYPLSSPTCLGTVPLNIIPLCHARKDGAGGCNNLKLDKDPETWLIEQFGDGKAMGILKRIRDYFEWIKGGA